MLSKARRRDGHSSDLTTAPLDFTSLNVLGSTPPLESLARWHLGSRRHVPAAGDHLYSPDWLILQARRPPDHLLSPYWLTVQARRHSVAQLARLDSLARFARSLASPRPRRRPLHPYPAPRRPSSLNSLNSLGSIRSLVDILTASSSSSAARRPHSARPAPYARRHFTGVVGGRTPTPRRPNLTCPPTCWV